MFCDRCGIQLRESQGFCPACGKPAGAVPLMPVGSRIAGHIRLLGIFWLALGALRLMPGVVLLVLFGHGRMGPEVPGFVENLLQVVAWVFLGSGVLSLAAGWGLLDRQSWARMLAIVVGCFSLLDLPFGTIVGIYTLWVLLPANSEAEYQRLSGAA